MNSALKTFKLQNTRHVILLIFLICLSTIGAHLEDLFSKKKAFEEDRIEVSNIKYGLFNVDEWKIILADLLTKNQVI